MRDYSYTDLEDSTRGTCVQMPMYPYTEGRYIVDEAIDIGVRADVATCKSKCNTYGQQKQLRRAATAV